MTINREELALRMLDRLAGNVAVFAGDADKNREFAKSVVAVAFGLADSVIALAGPESAGESEQQGGAASKICESCKEMSRLLYEVTKALGFSLSTRAEQLPEMIRAEFRKLDGLPGMRPSPSLPLLVRELREQKRGHATHPAILRALGFKDGEAVQLELIKRLKAADGEAAVWSQAAKKAELHAQAWQETAAQSQRNADYYRGIVYAIAEPFGERARTADDGTVADEPLAERVKELALQAIKCDQIARPGAPSCDALVPSALNGGYSSSDRFCERPAGHEGPHRCQAQWGEQCASEIETVDGKIVRCRLVEGHGANHEHKTPDYGVWVWASHDAIKPNKAEPLDRNPDRAAPLRLRKD